MSLFISPLNPVNVTLVKAMTHLSTPLAFDSPFDSLKPTTVNLSPADMDWAFQTSQRTKNSADQWPSFLRALALKGYQQWLEAGTTETTVSYEAEPPPAGVNCYVGEFRLCLVVQGNLCDGVVEVPKATLESGAGFAHLYVLIEVQEEAQRVTVLSGLRRDRLLIYQQITPLEISADKDSYTLPIQYFDTPPEELLLYLSCLSSQAFSEKKTLIKETVDNKPINVGCWLKNQIGEFLDSSAWTLLPPLTFQEPAFALRSPEEDIETVLTEIAAEVEVPASAKGAYTDCQSAGLPVRLYVFTWPLFETSVPEWSLLLCLGSHDSRPLPPGIQLIIRDRQTQLIEQIFDPSTPSSYLYSQIIGQWNEQFEVSVRLPNATTVSWPPFVFQPESQPES